MCIIIYYPVARDYDMTLFGVHNQEIAQVSPDPFPRERVGSGDETTHAHKRYGYSRTILVIHKMQQSSLSAAERGAAGPG